MAGGIQVVRFELRAALDKPLYDHVRGLTRPPTAYGLDDDPVPENETDEQRTERREAQLAKLVKAGLLIPLGGVGLERARKIITEHRAKNKNRRGRKANPILDGLIAGPHPRGSSEEWTRERVEQWGRKSLDWVKQRVGPGMVIVEAAIHLDETSPHLQFLAIPIEGGKLSWKAARDAAAKRILAERAPESGRKSRGFRDAYRTLQDDYHAQVGAGYGLARGEIGSEATHTSIDRTKAAEHRAVLAERRAEEAEERSVLAEVARDAAQRRAADLAHDNRIDSELEKVREKKLDDLRASADKEVERQGEAARVRSELVAEIRTLVAQRDATRVEIEAEDQALAHRREVASMLPAAARVVAAHERAAVRSGRLERTRGVRRLRTSERIRRREREAAVERREEAVAVAESRLRSGMVEILKTAMRFGRRVARVVSVVDSWADRLRTRQEHIKSARRTHQAQMAEFFASKKKLLDDREKELRDWERTIGCKEKEAAQEAISERDKAITARIEAERYAGAAFGLDAYGLVSRFRDLPERYGERHGPETDAVLQTCVAQRSSEPLFEAERHSRRKGKGKG